MRRGISSFVWRLCAVWLAGACAATAHAADAPVAGAIRKLESKRLTLYTDVPQSDEIDALPGLFDQAFPQWCVYFGIDPDKHADWRLTGFLMQARQRFVAAGLISPDLPKFVNGWAQGKQFWLYDQTSPYYRRHLLLHEGTHSFMHTLLGGSGPPWYTEATAELLATHRVIDGKLTLNSFPRSQRETSKLGRIELVQEAYAARQGMTLAKIAAFDGQAHSRVEAYAWCWAAAAFLDGHPRYCERFRTLPSIVNEPDFNERFFKLFAADWPLLTEEWQLFVANLDYGYDFERMTLRLVPGKPLPAQGAQLSVAADRGWQSAGVTLEAGKTYRLRASGRYQVADQPRVWWSEPGGVTLRYFNGQPLGMLMAAVRPDGELRGGSPLLRPTTIGLEATVAPQESGTLYLRINDSAGRLDDNAGAADVEVRGPS